MGLRLEHVNCLEGGKLNGKKQMQIIIRSNVISPFRDPVSTS